MAIFLDEDCAGTSTDIIGFPHLVSCMGIVVVTKVGMHGFHLVVSSSDNDGKKQLAEFGKYLTKQGQPILTLYDSCNFNIRYEGSSDRKKAWETELNDIGKLIGFATGGNAKGIDTSIIDPKDGTYVEYIRNENKNDCEIFFKRNEKMIYGPKSKTHGAIKFVKDSEVPAFSSESAKVKATLFNGGKLHEVDYAARLKDFKLK